MPNSSNIRYFTRANRFRTGSSVHPYDKRIGLPLTHAMKINLQDSTTVSGIIVVLIVLVALGYSILAIEAKPAQMAFTVAPDYTFPYQFKQSEWRVEMPFALKEISGITPYKEGELMAIQDEKGILFTVDINAGNITQQVHFGKDRDYEDLCRIGDLVFILERDGDLYEYNFATRDTLIKYETIFNYRNDTEGLGFDPDNNRLLITHKEGSPDGVILPEDTKCVFGFDLISKTVSPEPIVSIAQKEIGRIVGNGGKAHKFKPSAVGIHPHSGHIYILSSIGKVLVVVDPSNNKIQHVQLLDPVDFPQPEGLTFDRAGNMYLSSEGVEKAGFITKFENRALRIAQ